ncbi:MAG: hypothetical protein JKY54_04535 [Flavobacteriales bacterium]|nr:hypothetical protein [Flavobacteriales bacterium]
MNHRIFLLLGLLVFFAISCDNGPEYKIRMKKYEDDKIVSVFVSEPELLEAEEVFFGDDIALKKTYIVKDSGNVTFMVVNFSSEKMIIQSLTNVMEEFKESQMVSELELIEGKSASKNYYKGISNLSDNHYYVKFFQKGVKDVYYSMVLSCGAFPDSAMSMYFLQQTKPHYTF